jgi:hypothetical protein
VINPESGKKTIQHLEGGIIAEMRVRESPARCGRSQRIASSTTQPINPTTSPESPSTGQTLERLAPTVDLIPGMPVEVLIVTERRTMFYYIFKPFRDACTLKDRASGLVSAGRLTASATTEATMTTIMTLGRGTAVAAEPSPSSEMTGVFAE